MEPEVLILRDGIVECEMNKELGFRLQFLYVEFIYIKVKTLEKQPNFYRTPACINSSGRSCALTPIGCK
jgi:hypothetical protein